MTVYVCFDLLRSDMKQCSKSETKLRKVFQVCRIVCPESTRKYWIIPEDASACAERRRGCVWSDTSIRWTLPNTCFCCRQAESCKIMINVTIHNYFTVLRSPEYFAGLSFYAQHTFGVRHTQCRCRFIGAFFICDKPDFELSLNVNTMTQLREHLNWR